MGEGGKGGEGGGRGAVGAHRPEYDGAQCRRKALSHPGNAKIMPIKEVYFVSLNTFFCLQMYFSSLLKTTSTKYVLER